MKIPHYNLEYDDEHRIPRLVSDSCFETACGRIDSADIAGRLLSEWFRLRQQCVEHVILLCLNTKLSPICAFRVSVGTVNYAVFESREILTRALIVGATNMIVAHNHPSRDGTPSREDIAAAKKLESATRLIGIHLSDFLIIGEQIYSFLSAGLLDTNQA